LTSTVEPAFGLVISTIGLAVGGGAVTVSVAVPLTMPLDAVIVYVPAVAEVQLLLVPLAGEHVAPLLADHAGEKPATLLPNASVPIALNAWLPPARMLAVAGVTVMIARAAAVTVRVEVAVLPAYVAVTVYVPVFVAVQLEPVHVAPVSPPFGAMLNAVSAVLSPRSLFATSNAWTVYDRDVPAATVALVGSMTTWSGAPAITVSVAVPLTGPLFAVTVYVPTVVDVQVVSLPVTGSQFAPALADQAAAKLGTLLPKASVPLTAKTWFPPATIVALSGSTFTFARSDATTVRVALAEKPPLDAVTV
jgi:hypothetical protein